MFDMNTLQWQWKSLTLYSLALILLSLSYFTPITSSLWNAIDEKCYYWFNNSLIDSPSWRYFWSILNSRVGDWISEMIPLILLGVAIFELKGKERVKKSYESLFLLLVVTITLIFINKLFLIKILHIERLSPSLVLTPGISLSEAFPYLNNKDASWQSFPGDHATRIFLCSFLMFSICRPLLSWIGFLTGCIFILPRLFSGAHWLSDIIFGALIISSSVWILTTLTPLRYHFVSWCTSKHKSLSQVA
jgi:Kdo2-lipid A phosphotransferase